VGPLALVPAPLADRFASMRVFDPACTLDTATNSYEPESPCDPEPPLRSLPRTQRQIEELGKWRPKWLSSLFDASPASSCPSGPPVYFSLVLNRNFLFDFKHGDNSTPIWLACDIVKQDFHPGRAQRSDIRTSSAEIVRYSATFATSRPAQPLGDWIPLLTGPTSFLSRRYRQQRDPTQHRPERRRVRCPSASSSQ